MPLNYYVKFSVIKLQKIKKNSRKLVEEANALTKTLKVEDAKKLLKNDNYLFIDLRDYREILKEGKIPGSISCPRGMLEFWIDPTSPYYKKKIDDPTPPKKQQNSQTNQTKLKTLKTPEFQYFLKFQNLQDC